MVAMLRDNRVVHPSSIGETNMKIRTKALVLAVLSAVSGASLAESLIVPVENRGVFEKPGPLLQAVAADRSNARIDIVGVRADVVNARNPSIELTLPGGIEVKSSIKQFEYMESGNEVWVGSIDGFSSAPPVTGRLVPIDDKLDYVIAVRSGDTVMANIRVAGELFRLIPIDDGLHALVEVDQQKFLPDEDEKAYAEMLAAALPATKLYEQEPEVFSVAPKAISTIRIMVAFGPAAAAAVGNEQQAIDLAFTESNNALAATNTDIRFQQAGAIQFYTQGETTNYSTMLSRLTNLSDGFYDAIGGQRNTNTADMVAYVGPVSTGLCGQAAGIATSNANAYFIMNPQCLSGNYTFVHEAGHVVGTRHDNDPTLTPYAYGHGYVMSSINRRTVMAVNNGPCPSCTRVGAFSSPNYTISGVPIGTATRNDNNRVWRTRGPTVAAFR
jgi:hypothetical protein